jgi:hypothetical protein
MKAGPRSVCKPGPLIRPTLPETPDPGLKLRTPHFCSILLILLSVACAMGGPDGAGQHRLGSAYAECAPWDGPAFHVDLDSPVTADSTLMAAPVELRIYESVLHAVGSAIRLEGQDSRGVILMCTPAGECTPAVTGTVRIESFRTDSIRGTLEAVWPDGSNLASSFEAVWVERTLICG